MVRSKEVPDRRKEQGCACSYEAEEEDDDKWMFVVHEVVAQTGARIGDAAIGKGEVESSECGGDVDEYKAVEEAYGCVSSTVRHCNMELKGMCT